MIDILLATYNGEKYLSEQIESIFDQTFVDWKLLIHDDGSKDNTVSIIKAYQEKYPEKIIFLDDKMQTGGAKNNFSYLLEYSNAEYIMFCDQDDVWFRDKIESTYTAMKREECKRPDIPLLVHTDLEIVDKQLKCLHKSFLNYIGLDPSLGMKINYLLCQNCVTGCTVLINKKLKEICGKIPKDALMHDWWLALVASCFGNIIFVNKQTLAYRQHEFNTLGAQKFNLKTLCRGGFRYVKNKFKILDLTIKQAKAFMINYSDISPYNANIDIIKEYVHIKEKSFLARKRILVHYAFFRQGYMKNILWLLMV